MYRIIGADGREYGPVPAIQLREWIAEGRANALTRARAEGDTQWKPLTEYLEFAALLSRISPPPAAPRPIHLAPTLRTNSMALASLVMGILSLTCGMCCCYGLPFNLLGIIFALVALSQIGRDPQAQQGRGLAIAGLVLSCFSLVLAALACVLGVALSASDVMRKMERL
ncbi:MAG TPA: DUF4190 domain-containing protein [Candidatus Paceibacterota bacterium]|nr:DUF4190 domain-containing protein [Verrucomicrobiota bacterium]HSA11415.1 DUF4190 domain-containing protein [Candidatus Paceibacterota bacterium]